MVKEQLIFKKPDPKDLVLTPEDLKEIDQFHRNLEGFRVNMEKARIRLYFFKEGR